MPYGDWKRASVVLAGLSPSLGVKGRQQCQRQHQGTVSRRQSLSRPGRKIKLVDFFTLWWERTFGILTKRHIRGNAISCVSSILPLTSIGCSRKFIKISLRHPPFCVYGVLRRGLVGGVRLGVGNRLISGWFIPRVDTPCILTFQRISCQLYIICPAKRVTVVTNKGNELRSKSTLKPKVHIDIIKLS